ncbi:chemotaxis protein [Helicobacter didelphidarum]|uniref:protein-glutamate O-methyltransferase n=1 Tax=Helicobacter didelphidarum TaxID=2040648 RepID=A0A3D8IQY9_9HELI|nr:protein-glutamate O-methyltransferase CheR [Helicobacter didelphidarum]RDU67612.1 chemotaxis protein [Helicobacter didelphidarum]
MNKKIFQLDTKTLHQIQDALYETCGIHLTDTKQTMIQNRINVLLKDSICANIHSFDDLFCAIKNNPQIRQSFINNFTTNKTDLFRESYHFDDMLNRTLIPLLQNNESINIFCSASSSGEEPYSIAATCMYAKNIYQSHSTIKIIATDIDTNMLNLAKKGEYTLDLRLNKIPDWVTLDNYFDILKTTPHNTMYLRAKKSLKDMITFRQLNLFSKSYPFSNNEFDMIFCRNVLIYFKQSDQEKILAKLHNILKVGGTLYLGHSEDILGLSSQFDRLGNKIFIKNSESLMGIF